MLWGEARSGFEEAATAVADLVARVERWRAPALGTWDVAALAGHTLRAITAPGRYTEKPEPVGASLPDAAAYYLAYLAWRASEDPVAADAEVAARGEQTAAEVGAAGMAAAYREAIAAARRTLDHHGPDRLVPTPFGTMRLAAYLPTRTLELVVHGLDLAHAGSLVWAPPPASLEESLVTVARVAARAGNGGDVLLAMTGREWVMCDRVLPVIR